VETAGQRYRGWPAVKPPGTPTTQETHMKAFINSVFTTYGPGLGFRRLIACKVNNKSFSFWQNFGSGIVPLNGNLPPTQADDIAEAVNNAGLIPNSNNAYAVYNGDVEGPESGHATDVVECEIDTEDYVSPTTNNR
jgi:hypothetical protein